MILWECDLTDKVVVLIHEVIIFCLKHPKGNGKSGRFVTSFYSFVKTKQVIFAYKLPPRSATRLIQGFILGSYERFHSASVPGLVGKHNHLG